MNISILKIEKMQHIFNIKMSWKENIFKVISVVSGKGGNMEAVKWFYIDIIL